MYQVIVKDFQAVEEAKIRVDGVTLLLGESNAGKSAILRAIQAAMTNRFKAGQVRYGQDHATIKVKFEDSDEVLTVIRSYSGGSPVLQLGKETFSKLGRTMPKSVQDFLKLGQMDLNGETYNCNFHVQFQKPLLLEYSQQRVMELLSASSALDDLKLAKDLNLQERQKNKGAIQVVDKLINDTKDSLTKAQSELEVIRPLVSSIKEKYNTYTSNNDRLYILSLVQSHLKTIKELESKIDLYTKYTLTYLKYQSNQVITDKISEYLNLSTSLSRLLKRQSLIQDILSKKSEIDIVSLEKVEKLQFLLQSLNSINSQVTKAASKVDLLSRIKELELASFDKRSILIKVNSIKNTINSLSMVNDRIKELNKIVVDKICPICGNKVNNGI